MLRNLLLIGSVLALVLAWTHPSVASPIQPAPPTAEQKKALEDFNRGLQVLWEGTSSAKLEWITGDFKQTARTLDLNAELWREALEQIHLYALREKDEWVLWNLIKRMPRTCRDLHVQLASHSNPAVRAQALQCDIDRSLELENALAAEPEPWVISSALEEWPYISRKRLIRSCKRWIRSKSEPLAIAGFHCFAHTEPPERVAKLMRDRSTHGSAPFRQEAIWLLTSTFKETGPSVEWANAQFAANDDPILIPDMLFLLKEAESPLLVEVLPELTLSQNDRLAAYALGLAAYELAPEQAIRVALRRIEDESDWIANEATNSLATVLGRSETALDSRALAVLIQITRSPRSEYQFEKALEGLERGGADAARHVVSLAMDSSLSDHRRSVAINRIRFSDWRDLTVDALETLSDDTSKTVRDVARGTLREIREGLRFREFSCLGFGPSFTYPQHYISTSPNSSIRCHRTPERDYDRRTLRLTSGRVSLVERFFGTQLWAGIEIENDQTFGEADCWLPFSELTALAQGSAVPQSLVSPDEFDVAAEITLHPSFVKLERARVIEEFDSGEGIVGVRWILDESSEAQIQALAGASALRETPIGERALEVPDIREAWSSTLPLLEVVKTSPDD